MQMSKVDYNPSNQYVTIRFYKFKGLKYSLPN